MSTPMWDVAEEIRPDECSSCGGELAPSEVIYDGPNCCDECFYRGEPDAQANAEAPKQQKTSEVREGTQPKAQGA